MANIRPANNPFSAGIGEIIEDDQGNLWHKSRRTGKPRLVSTVEGSIVRVIGVNSGGRVVISSASSSQPDTPLDADDLITNTSAFGGLLSATDDTIQDALDTLDDHVHVHSTNTVLTADDHTQYALLAGRAGGQSLSGGDAANDDLTLQGTTHATRTTSYLLLQPNGGNVGIGVSAPAVALDVLGIIRGSSGAALALILQDGSGNQVFRGVRATTMWSDLVSAQWFQIGTSTDNVAFTSALGNPATRMAFDTQQLHIVNSTGSAAPVGIFDISNANTKLFNVLTTGRVGIGNSAPTARLHLPAGTATASTGPLKFTPAGAVLVTAAESGLVEAVGDLLYYTIPTGPTRKTIAFTDADHGELTGRADDDHSIYALLAGRGPGQTFISGTNAGVNMYLESTSNLTKGMIVTYDTMAVYSDYATAKFLMGGGGDMGLGYDGTDGVLNSSLVAASDINITCGANKTIELQNVVYKDTNIAGALLVGNPTVTPGEVEFLNELGAATGIFTYGFAVDEGVHGCFELQHDYAEGTDIVPHVHWQGIAAPSGTDNVQWRLTYTVSRDNTTLDAATTIDSVDTAIDTQYKCYRTDFGAITGTNFKIGDQFLFSLFRVAATGDAYAGVALIMTAGIHYQVNTLGSRTIMAK